MYLLDTDHCVLLLRRDRAVHDHLGRGGGREACIGIITVGELLFGAYRSARPQENLFATNRFLDGMAHLPLTRSTMDRFARVKADLSRRGRKIEDPDILIAATAMENNLILVTHNTAHYQRIAGLQLEDWSA